MNYHETLDYLYTQMPVFHQIGAAAYKPGLQNTIKLLNSLNNPHKKFKTIHVAGTNGKGSVSHMLAAIFQSAGYKTGLYTSPHLVDFGERIRVNGKMIDQQYVINFVENNKELFTNIQPSFFEATMAMSFCYFEYQAVDIAIIEVGLGGRLDSTNIIEPLASVITNISFDHIGFLGDTIGKIAFEKAGIIKDNTPVIIGENQKETKAVFELKASGHNSAIYFSDLNLKVEKYEHNKMICSLNGLDQFKVGLMGNYQLKNVATVLKTIEVLNTVFDSKQLNLKPIPTKAIYNGIENVVELTGLRGRWEVLSNAPKTIADTGHNVAGIEYIVNQLKNENFNKLHIVIGMVNDKDIRKVLQLLPKNAHYYFTQANIFRALPAIDLKNLATAYTLSGECYSSVIESVNAAKKTAKKDDLIFIGGSNFVVGEYLSLL